MKTSRTISLLLAGVVLGIVASFAFLHLRRTHAIKSLPTLADRNHHPLIDELTSVTLVRRGDQLDLLTGHGLGLGGRPGATRRDFEAWLALQRKFWPDDDQPIVSVRFEPGVTMEDLDSTLEYLHSVGVDRYFIGYSYYGKFIP